MRVIASFIMSVAILFVGFYGTIILIFATGNDVYGLVSAAFVMTLLIFANLLVWQQFSKKP